MGQKTSAELRKILWNLMTDQNFAEEARKGGIVAAAKAKGHQITEEEAARLSAVDLDDLGGLLTMIERDLTLMMGGSRPRRSVALSDGAIAELQEALKNASRTEDGTN